MNNISRMNQKLAEFAERIPAKGMHISYLSKCIELMDLYGEAMTLMEDDETTDNEIRIATIVAKIEEIVG